MNVDLQMPSLKLVDELAVLMIRTLPEYVSTNWLLKPAIVLNKVDLPTPLGPRRQISWPASQL